MADQTNEFVANAATHIGQLPLNRVRLVSVFTGPDDTRAILRTSDGDMLIVHDEDQTEMGRIAHIAPEFVLLDTGDGVTRLSFPS